MAGKKVKRVRANDLSTGKLIWLTPGQLKQYEKRKESKARREFENERKRQSAIFDKPKAQITSLDLYDNADSPERIKRLIRADKSKRLRYKGRYITKDAQDRVLEFSEILHKQGVEFTLNDLLAVPDIKNKILITKSQTPKEIFYWNMQNLVYQNVERPRAKNHKKTFGKSEYKIVDFDGTIMYKGRDAVRAAEALLKANRKLEALTKVISEVEGTDPYFTVHMYDETRDGEFYRITVDLSGLQGRISNEIFNKYKTML